MTPIGHLSISYLLGRKWGIPALAATLAGGLCADVDILLKPLPYFNLLHRVVTHNLLFVALTTAVAWLVLRYWPKQRGIGTVGFAAAAVIHLAIDATMDTNPTNGLGIALLWPWSDRMFCPFNLMGFVRPSRGWSDLADQLRSMAWQGLFEIPLLLTAGLLCRRQWSRTDPSTAHRTRRLG